MPLIECVECNKEISDQATSCPHCGVPMKSIKQQKKKSGCFGVILKLFFAIVILFLLFVIFSNPKGNRENRRQKLKAAAAKTVEAPAREYVDLSCYEFTNIFGSTSKLSKIQKNELFREYKGRWAKWQGEVVEISETWGKPQLQIKCHPDTFVSDAIVFFDKETRDELMSYSKGNMITFEARIDSWGALMQHTLKEGRIVGK